MDVELLMNQNVAQAHNILPRYKPHRALTSAWATALAKRLIGGEARFRSAGDRFRDPVEGFQNVAQSLIVTPHISGGLRRAQPTESAASMRV